MESTNLYAHKIQQRKNSKDESLFSEHSPVPAPLKRQQQERKKAFQSADNSSTTSETRRGKMPNMDSPRSSKHESPRSQYDSPRSHRSGIETAVAKNNENDDIDGEHYNRKQKEDRRRLEEVDHKLAELKRLEDEERREEERRLREVERELDDKLRQKEQERIDLDREISERKRKKAEEEEDERRQAEREKRREEEILHKRQQEERKRLDDEEEERIFREKQRKKELLLAKMQLIDKGENPTVSLKNEPKTCLLYTSPSPRDS